MITSPTPARLPSGKLHASFLDPAEANELGADLRAQLGGWLVGAGDQQ